MQPTGESTWAGYDSSTGQWAANVCYTGNHPGIYEHYLCE
jgi:hypothetical protein